MKDKEILEEVYRRITVIATNGDANVPSQERFKEFRDFIETEWQREDEIEAKLDKIERKERGQKAKDQELVNQYNRNREVKDHVSTVDEIRKVFFSAKAKADAKSLGQFSKTWYKDDKRHRELEIGKDGTVKKIL